MAEARHSGASGQKTELTSFLLHFMIATYQYGEPRTNDALRIGVARHAPRGIRHQDYRRKNYFDLWLRMLGPSPELLGRYRKGEMTWRKFASEYRSEMKQTEPRQVIEFVALLSKNRSISIGCYCEKEACCHRSILKRLIESAGAMLPTEFERGHNASPVCFAGEEAL